MTSAQLKTVRVQAGLTQTEMATRLRVSQPYFSLLERGLRQVPERLAQAVSRAFHLSPALLPLPGELTFQRRDFPRALATLGYPGYSHLRGSRPLNPALVVLHALAQESLDARVAQALPWVLLRYPELDWNWLASNSRLRNLQNRLGFLVAIARELAERSGRAQSVAALTAAEQALESSRLAAETTLGKASMPSAERVWLRSNRSPLAAHWNVLTSMSPEHLPYAA